MIDTVRFNAGMALLAGNFGREVDGPVLRAYYAVLSPKLTTEQFDFAVAKTVETETYWPAAATLIAKVLAPQADAGVAALRHVNATMGKHGGFQYLPFAVYQAEFDAPTKDAIKAVGGIREIANVHEDRYAALERKFVAAYERARTAPPALPAPATDPHVDALVRDTARGKVIPLRNPHPARP